MPAAAINLRLLSLLAALVVAAGASWGVAPAEARDPIVLVSNAEITVIETHDLSNDRAQQFTTGNNPLGYTITGVSLAFQVQFPEGEPLGFALELWSLNADGSTDELLGTFANPATLTDRGTANVGTYWAAPGDGLDLEPETSYLVVFDVLQHGTLGASLVSVRSDSEDNSGEYGWAIHNSARTRAHGQTGSTSWSSYQHSLWIRVEGHEIRYAPSPSEVEATSGPGSALQVSPANRASLPCRGPQPSLRGAEQLANVRLACNARTGEWVKVQYAVPGRDYALESQLQPGNRAANGCESSQKYDPIRKTCLTYAPGR